MLSKFYIGMWLGVYSTLYPQIKIVELVGYFDADRAQCNNDHKSTLCGWFYLGNSLISYHNKKQRSVSLSTTKAKYIATSLCYSQLLRMKQLLTDYGIKVRDLVLLCGNTPFVFQKTMPNIQEPNTSIFDITSLET